MPGVLTPVLALDRIVAVKVSKTEFSERFDREAKANRLSPWIVGIRRAV